MFDLVIDHATVVDGTGAPGRVASVGVRDGRIVRIEPWGDEGAIFVEGEKRAFASFVFERDEEGSQ